MSRSEARWNVIVFVYAAVAVVALLWTMYGCTAVERRTVDLCAELTPGASTVASVRPSSDGVLGDKNLAWPWISPQALFATRTEAGLCTVETEPPKSSDLMSMMSSPISAVINHATVPVVP